MQNPTCRATLATALMAALQFLTASCSTPGTKHADAFALDVTTEPSPAASAVAIAAAAATSAALEPPAQAECAPELPGQIAAIRAGAVYHYRERRTTTTKPPPTISQRVSAWLGTGLGIGGLGIIAAAFLCPAALAGFFLRLALKWRAAFTQTVAGIETAKAASAAGNVTDHLAITQTTETQRMVARELTK